MRFERPPNWAAVAMLGLVSTVDARDERGAVAQLGERCNRTAEVRGSIPLSSMTIEAALPLGVTGNTPDSGSGESWFEPRRGNSKARGHFGGVGPFSFLRPAATVSATVSPTRPLFAGCEPNASRAPNDEGGVERNLLVLSSMLGA